MPFRRMRGVARGVMGWSERDFWTTTMHGYVDALEALSRFHSAGGDDEDEDEFAAFKDEVVANLGTTIKR